MRRAAGKDVRGRVPYGSARCLQTALSERGARIEIESDDTFGEEEKSGNI